MRRNELSSRVASGRFSVRSFSAKAALCSLALLAVWRAGLEGQPSDAGESRNFDARIAVGGGLKAAPLASHVEALEALRGIYPALAATSDEGFGVTRTLMNQAGYLTLEDRDRAPLDIALDYVQAGIGVLGLEPGDLADYEVTDVVSNTATGSTHVYLRQTYQGLPVYNAQLQVNVNRDGRILSVNNQFVRSLSASVNLLAPGLSAAEAVAAASAHLKQPPQGLPRVLETSAAVDSLTSLDPSGISQQPIKARLMLLPIQAGVVRLVWNFQMFTLDSQHAYDMTVDAETGAVWTRFDWTAGDSYAVYPWPVESPNHTSPAPPADARILVPNPADVALASPYGWHDIDGAPGAEYQTMRGNNVHAYDDANGDNNPPAVEFSCGPTILCNFGLDLNQAPAAYIAAATANLFYWANINHDIHYRYGFTERAGNFQQNNYGRGGLGNDYVRAEAQDPAASNAIVGMFTTLPDGQAPRMQVGVWTPATPDRDGALDAGLLVHEYGHGVSNRLVGGPSNVSCLGNLQAPGEGISDWWALVLTARQGDTGGMVRGPGTYLLNQPTTGHGFPSTFGGFPGYTIDQAINNLTYASINNTTSPYRIGVVFSQVAWEMYWALVNAHGFDANLYNAAGTAGNQRAMLYMTYALMLTPCSPTFVNLRDALIQAALDNYGGADACRLWTSFAQFGLGVDAVSGGPGSTAASDGYLVPAICLAPTAPSVSINDVYVSEGSPTARFTVSLSGPSPVPVSVDFATGDGTASSAVSDVPSTYTNGTGIIVPSGSPTTTSGPASPYPSQINVAGFSGFVAKVIVRLNGFSHTFPSDVDVLLVGPGGQSVVLMSDVGGATDVSGLSLTFNDSGGAVPVTLVSGTYRPTNSGTGDVFPAPAPAGPHGTTLSVFNALNPNGAWRLFVFDDAGADVGSISLGWNLFLQTAVGDYAATSGVVSFPPGAISQTLTVPLVGDSIDEPNESFFVNLLGPLNARLGDAHGVGTILDDDAGPTVPANPIGDIAVDFGSPGLWVLYNQGFNAQWSQLHPASPSVMTAGDIDGNGQRDLIVNFAGAGLWVWKNNGPWLPLHPLDASDIETGDLDGNGMDDVIINFPGAGLWAYFNNSTWTQLHVFNTTQIAIGNVDGDGGGLDDLVVDFPGNGVWRWLNNTAWSQLHTFAAADIQTGDLDANGQAEVILSFSGIGIWLRVNNSSWFQLHTSNPAGMAVGNIDGDAGGRADVVVNFPGVGVWAYRNNATWGNLHPANAAVMAVGDLDGNSREEVVLNFPGQGVWVWKNDLLYQQVHPLDAQAAVTGRIDAN